MKCEHCQRLLDAYVEGLLLPLDRASLETHLGACERCAREAGELANLVHVLRELPEPEVPGDFTETIMANLPEMLPQKEGTGHLLRWGIITAVSLFAFVAGIALLPKLGGPGVARDTLMPLSASLQLGGSVLAQAVIALGSVLDAIASTLVSTGLVLKAGFALLVVGSNVALAAAVQRYRQAWMQHPACLRTSIHG